MTVIEKRKFKWTLLVEYERRIVGYDSMYELKQVCADGRAGLPQT